MPDRALLKAVEKLLTSIGRPGPFTLSSVLGGGNNRAYKVQTADGPLFLKQYFDARRLRAEFSFARFAWRCGVRAMAEPLAQNAKARLGLYSYLDGRAARPSDVTAKTVDAALRFFFAVNGARGPRTTGLPNAAEACFSLSEHLACVERRLAGLSSIRGGSPTAKAARRFVNDELLPAWILLRSRLVRKADEAKLPLNRALPPQERRRSPSDFGFHNARLDARRKVFFVDFEYAGWDDPAKMVNDFFCQPRVPVPARFRAAFVKAVARRQPHPEAFQRRASWLTSIYEVKWCCIMMNEFLPIGRQRRRFAKGRAGEPARQATQLAKARRALQLIMAREFQS